MPQKGIWEGLFQPKLVFAQLPLCCSLEHRASGFDLSAKSGRTSVNPLPVFLRLGKYLGGTAAGIKSVNQTDILCVIYSF